jgi:hypothetical protein
MQARDYLQIAVLGGVLHLKLSHVGHGHCFSCFHQLTLFNRDNTDASLSLRLWFKL